MKNENQKLKIIPLGGAGSVTKNMFVYESEKDIVVVDCGMGFPDESMLGVDLVIPDISYLLERRKKVRGIVITHGHEDHMGALPYILPQLNVPVFGTRLTMGLIEVKLKEHQLLKKVRLQTVNMDQQLQLGDFHLSFFAVCHSIQDAMGIILKTPVGIIVHAADYKFDWTPVDGQTFEVEKLAILKKQGGIKVLLSDCLRIEKEGYTLSEKAIGEAFDRETEKASGRVMITTFSSNISRIQQAAEVAAKHHRYLVLVGRSVEQNVEVARKLGYLRFPAGILVKVDQIKGVAPQKLMLIVAGSQGQSGSAMVRIANRDHRFVRITEGDTVIFASDPIPGYSDGVYNLIDRLSDQGANVIYSEITDDVHVSGHASKQELALMLGLTKPEYLIPIGGLLRHQKHLALLAQEMGMPKDHAFILKEGDAVELGPNWAAKVAEKVSVSDVMVDGTGIGDVGEIVLRDRQVLAEEGIFVVIINLDKKTGKLIHPPDIISRGFVFMKESEDLIARSQKIVEQVIAEHSQKQAEKGFIRRKIIDGLERFLYGQTERRPMVLPVIIEL
ncbi:ribonuclease J [candidate division WWE3 bacterium CG_4_9_14_3_um_filter_43_9]|uniref:Ribonuclease J n=1 Tax=candidate division WWE3 bacterium CG_4_9_14_3_um_filter_43_9 TaxID=1975082 RepID=A0A2M7WYS1_UNCKA|nr:MAG: ribonuclease J [candidate division WWE3 bacterium CG_4_9_14_3_um_filter_43_9]